MDNGVGMAYYDWFHCPVIMGRGANDILGRAGFVRGAVIRTNYGKKLCLPMQVVGFSITVMNWKQRLGASMSVYEHYFLND